MYCPECDKFYDNDDDEILTGRDGDPYDPSTNFWSICPICLTVLIDDSEANEEEDACSATLSRTFTDGKQRI